MKYFYSKTTNGAYMDELHSAIPEDAVEISKDLYERLFTTVIDGAIGSDEKGFPILVPEPVPTDAKLAAKERAWRDSELLNSDGVVARHRDEVEAGGVTSLTLQQYKALQLYRAQLRDWPVQNEFPNHGSRPIPPDWLESQTK